MTVTDMSSTATSKRRRLSAVEGDDDHDGRHPPTATAAAAPASAWTEEMHSSFMDRMEAAFVHGFLFRWPAAHAPSGSRDRMIQQPQQPGLVGPAASAAAPSLDRYVPDSAESTWGGHGGAASRWHKRSRGRNMMRSVTGQGGPLFETPATPAMTEEAETASNLKAP